MLSFYAICPFCNKSIFVEENISGGFACPLCAQALGINYLKDNNLIIDVQTEQEEYNLGQQYFVNTDFREAGTHFYRALQCNKNNYLADYYYRLCDIYENEDKEDFNAPAMLIETIKSSTSKMVLSMVKLNNKIEFLSSILNQAYIILFSYYNNILENFEKTEKWDELRSSCLNMAGHIRDLTLIDKETMLIFDQSISKSLISITDLGICACQKAVAPHLIGKRLDTSTEFEFNKAKSIYNQFVFYANALDPKYNFANYKPDYTSNLLYNEGVIGQLTRYNNDNKSNFKKYLSIINPQLDDLTQACKTAIKFSYYNCFKGLVNSNTDQSRLAIINESISFCFEIIKPRISIGNEKKLNILISNYSQAIEFSTYMNAFIEAFAEYNRRLTSEYLNKFFDELHEQVKLYFSVVYNSYNKFVNKLKESQNTEFTYYKNFLYKITCCCALALKDIVNFDQHKLVNRIKILKLGKQVAEEFLLLCDYKIEEIESSSKYSDILDIFNAFDNSIEFLGSKR